MAVPLLVLGLGIGLLLIPFGLPGLWLMVGAALAFSYAEPASIGAWTLVGMVALALIAELLEFVLAGRYARKYGGSRRAAWGAIVGGIVGAFVGVPVPVVGSVIGAFAGSFVGALVAELTRGAAVAGATRVATGALLGRVVATGMKVGVGMMVAVWALAAVWL